MSPNKSFAIIIKSTQKCRCCRNPSSRFFKLDAFSKSCGPDKTYKDVLYEITNINVSQAQEKSLTQKVCQKCSNQLNNCYKFILQAREVFEQYLSNLEDLSTENNTKDFYDIPEPLIEVPIDLVTVEKSPLQAKESPIPTNISPLAANEIKTEPLGSECTSNACELMNVDNLQVNEIKEEKPDFAEESTTSKSNDISLLSSELTKEKEQKVFTNDQTYEEEREHSDSEDEDDLDKYLSKAPVAISCNICHKIYKDKVALRTHKQYTHMPDENKRPCPLCNFKSSRLSHLKVHIGFVHGAGKVKEVFKPLQFSCSLCHQSFRHKDTLQKHIKRIHQNPQPKKTKPKAQAPKEKERFLCTYCGDSFCTKYSLERHVARHTGVSNRIAEA